jgi:hypothetical protein
MPSKKKYTTESTAQYNKRKSLTGKARKKANQKAASKTRSAK